MRPDAFWGHKFGYDFETLSLLPHQGAGRLSRFVAPRKRHVALACSASRVAGYRHGEDYFSLFSSRRRAMTSVAAVPNRSFDLPRAGSRGFRAPYGVRVVLVSALARIVPFLVRSDC